MCRSEKMRRKGEDEEEKSVEKRKGEDGCKEEKGRRSVWTVNVQR